MIHTRSSTSTEVGFKKFVSACVFMSTFTFTGQISLGRSKHSYEREVEAESESHAEDKLYSELGSEHSVNRNKIEIESVEK